MPARPRRRRETAELRSVHTRNGCYFLPWRLETLQALLRRYPLSAADFELDQPETHRFLRDLFVLSAQECLAGDGNGAVSRLARNLYQSYAGRKGPARTAGERIES